MAAEDMMVDDLLGQILHGKSTQGAILAATGSKKSKKRSAKNTVKMETVFVDEESLVVLPGDRVTHHIISFETKLCIGSGLVRREEDVFATRAGILRHLVPNVWWVDSNQKRYVPKVEDHVLGIIESRMGNYYKVNIYAHSSALLPLEAFDGATKRNKPNLKDGAVVFCRVSAADKDMDPELSCMAAGHAVKKDWMTHEGTFGELVGGMNARCSLMQARRLMQPDCAVLSALGDELAFEIAVGENGGYWVNSAGGSSTTTVIVNAIRNAEYYPADQHTFIVKHCLSTMRAKFIDGLN